MELPDLARLRRFALTVAIVLIALVIAGVELETPVHISPLGVPLVIHRPDLLTIAIVIAAIYATLRYIYYGMLVHASPMRARRELMSRTERRFTRDPDVLDDFQRRVQVDIDRYFPHVGRSRVTFQPMQDAIGIHVKDMKVPRPVRVVCWIEDLDFLLPIASSMIAVGVWAWTNWHGT